MTNSVATRILMMHMIHEEEEESHNANEDHFDTEDDNQIIFGTQIPNEQVQDVQDVTQNSAYPNIECEERNADITDMNAIEIDRVINFVVNFHKEKEVKKVALRTRSKNNYIISSSTASSTSETRSKCRISPSTVSSNSGTRSKCKINSSTVNSPRKVGVKIQQTLYKWLLAPLMGEEKWESNSKEELTQEELTQSQTDPEQEANAESIPQLSIHPVESVIKTKKQQSLYEWLLAPLTE
ncbi:hypothetical protein DVH24_042133 [Malus domestica]|uniref:Uncharacterized protein n=1 Tax=Malus domestica TaxID=3750 RepID=A0A498J254_MALDO|nr:hypothetical protein DVH24_042133 [Malus domestica]